MNHDNFPAAIAQPTAFLLDANGRGVERFSGRIPAQASDRIAELMP